MSEPFELKIEGLAELAKGLRDIDRSLGKAITRALTTFTKKTQTRAETIGAGLGGVHAHVVRRKGIGRFASQTQAGLVLKAKDKNMPEAFGAEFGALAYKQFPPYRGNQWTDPTGSQIGYMIHPAIRQTLPTSVTEIADEIAAEIDRVIGGIRV